MEEQQPGQVISPGGAVPQSSSPTQADSMPLVVPQQPVPSYPIQQPILQSAPNPVVASVEQQPAADVRSEVQDAPPEKWQDPKPFNDEQDQAVDLAWNAAEYVHHKKDATWYGAFTLGSILLGALIFFFTKDVVSTAVVVLATGGLLFVSARQPNEQSYALYDGEIQVGRKIYQLHDFKAFSVDEQPTVLGVTLMPLKRFMPPITLYVDEAHEQAVVAHISNYLPMEPHKADAMDSLLRRLRF